jgi:hypothetical protein
MNETIYDDVDQSTEFSIVDNKTFFSKKKRKGKDFLFIEAALKIKGHLQSKEKCIGWVLSCTGYTKTFELETR